MNSDGKSWETTAVAVVCECDGSWVCGAEVHVHGCFSDWGNCEAPNEYHGNGPQTVAPKDSEPEGGRGA